MALIEFENYPSTDTAMTADNLNHNFNELDNKIKSSNAKINNLKAKTLWTNPDPPISAVAEFNAQTITFENNDCDIFELLVTVMAGSTNYVQSYRFRVGDNVYMTHSRFDGEIYVVTRTIESSSTSITFQDAAQNGIVRNTRMIPLKLLGYKA